MIMHYEGIANLGETGVLTREPGWLIKPILQVNTKGNHRASKLKYSS